MRYHLVILSLLSVLLLNSGCLTDSDESGAPAKKSLLLTRGRTKLIQNEQEHFQVTSSPEPEPTECLVWQFTGPDTVICIVQPAQTQNDIEQISFTDGDWVLRIAIYDSSEYHAKGEQAVYHGGLIKKVTVREVTVDLSAQSGGTPYDFVFRASSPERECLHEDTDYLWDFGDGVSTIATDTDITAHHYDIGGIYQVIVSITCTLYENDPTKYTIVSDTLEVLVNQDIAGLLDIDMSPSDTLWNTLSPVDFYVDLNINYSDYPADVSWAIDYGDGESLEFIGHLYDRYVSHHYNNTGTYLLNVAIYNPSTGLLLAEDSAVVTILNLPFLQQINTVTMYINGFITRHYGTVEADSSWSEISEVSSYSRFGSNSSMLTWNGYNFSAEDASNTGSHTLVSRFNGTVSDEIDTIVMLECTKDLWYTDDLGNTYTRFLRIVLENVPLTTNTIYSYSFFETGADVGHYITEFEWWNRTEYTDGTIGYDYFEEFDWSNNLLGTPYITVDLMQQ